MDLNSGLTQALSDGTYDYIYGLGRIAQVNAATQAPTFFLTDALGSVRQLTDSTGAVTFSQSYAPYGTVSTTSGSASSYGFTGEYQNSYIKLIYLRSRMYSSLTGRFLTKDTWQGDYTRPLSLNRWNYTESNPVNYTDPSGLIPVCPFPNDLDCLSFFGAIPDYKGIAVVELYNLLYKSFDNASADIEAKGLHKTTVAAGIAVQSQYFDSLGVIEDGINELKKLECISSNPIVQKVLRKVGGDSMGLGWAKDSQDKYGDLHIMANSIRAMTERIKNGIQYCIDKSCSDKDKLIAAGMAQNGFKMYDYDFNEYLQSGKLIIDWERYFSSQKPLTISKILGGEDQPTKTDPINDLRAGWRYSYNTRYQLQLFTQDMIVLNSVFKWELPPGIQTGDLWSMMKLALVGQE